MSSTKTVGVIMDWVPAHFPARRICACGLRRIVPVRTRDPSSGRSRLGDPLLQLRAQGGRKLPARERARMARPLPYRRIAVRCGCLHALPQFLARQLDTEQVRRKRESRRNRFSEARKLCNSLRLSRNNYNSGGKHDFCRGDQAGWRRRLGVRLQMESRLGCTIHSTT